MFNDENGDGSSQVGETISYIFSVTNNGTSILYNITLDDPLPGIVMSGGPILELLPGVTDNTTFTATYAITQADIDALMVVNQAIGVAQDDEGNEVTDLSDDTDIIDDDPDTPTVTILPNVLAPFEIFNGITPDGDGLNDFFLVQGISNYPINNVKIYNRWGVLVFQVDNYGGSNDMERVFAGRSEGRITIENNRLLPTGTYYYVISFPEDNPGKSGYAGYLYLNR